MSKIIKKIDIVKVNDYKNNVIVEVDDNFWIAAQEKVRKEAISKVDVKGFRKGTAPENIANNYIDQTAVFHEAVNNVLTPVFEELLSEKKIKPFLQPHVHIEKFSTTNLVVCFEIFTTPKVELCDYKNINIKYPKNPVVTEEEVEKSIIDFLKKKAEYVIKDTAIENGDQIIFDFEGFVDGKPFAGGKAEKYTLIVGDGNFIPGFEEQLIGLKKGDKKDVNVVFPKDYREESLKGKKAVFKCLIHEIKKVLIPALNDENIAKLNIPNVKTKEDLIKQQKEILLERKKNALETEYFNRIISYIRENSKVDLSEEIINYEVLSMKNNISHGKNDEWKKYLDNLKQTEKQVLDNLYKEAKDKITISVIFESIIEKENISVTDEDVENEYKKLSLLYKMDVARIKEIFSKNVNYMKVQIIENKM